MYIYKVKRIDMSYFKEIKDKLSKGEQFGNNGFWYTINRPNEGVRMIVIGEQNKFYKNLDSYAKRVKQLINNGL